MYTVLPWLKVHALILQGHKYWRYPAKGAAEIGIGPILRLHLRASNPHLYRRGQLRRQMYGTV